MLMTEGNGTEELLAFVVVSYSYILFSGDEVWFVVEIPLLLLKLSGSGDEIDRHPEFEHSEGAKNEAEAVVDEFCSREVEDREEGLNM